MGLQGDLESNFNVLRALTKNIFISVSIMSGNEGVLEVVALLKTVDIIVRNESQHFL